MELTGKKVIVLLDDMFHEHELIYPYYRAKEAGAETFLVGGEAGKTYHAKSGLTATAELGISSVKSQDFDGVVIPGGYSPDHMRRKPAMVALVREMFEQQKPVAAICHAGWMLVSAGILKGRRVTSFFAIKDDMVNAGALWVDQEVVVDGKLITSRQPGDLPAFMREFIKACA